MPSFGERLRRERESRNITLREIAESTKISVAYLDALESDEFSRLPGGVFDRGYVRAYAQFMGLDPDSLVDAYLAERESRQLVEDGGASLEALRGAVGAGAPAAAAEVDGRRNNAKLILVGALALTLLTVSAWAFFRFVRPGEMSGEAGSELAAAQGPVRQVDEPAPENSRPPSLESQSVAALDTQDAGVRPSPPTGEPLAPRARQAEQAPQAKAQPAEIPPAPMGNAEPAPRERETAVEREPSPARTAAAGGPVVDARVVIDRAVVGSLNCDNRQVEILDGLRPGTVLELRCRRFLLIDARDGGGLRVGLSGATPEALVADGEPLNNYRIRP